MKGVILSALVCLGAAQVVAAQRMELPMSLKDVELGSAPIVSAEQEQAITRHLFRVALAARAGAAVAAEHAVRTDPEIARALERLAHPGAAP